LPQELDDQARARELFEEGVAAAERTDYAAAVEAFARSYELYSHPGTLSNLAQYQEQVGQRADAYRSWSELIERFGTIISAGSLRRAQQRVAALDAELCSVWVSVVPAGASVQIDGGEVWPTPMDEPVRLEPGQHEFVARREGFEDASVTREIQAGVNPDVRLTLTPVRDEPRPSFLRVESTTASASVSIDGGALHPAPVRVPIEPGEHEVRVVALGHQDQTRRVTALPEQETVASFELVREARRETRPAPPREQTTRTRDRARRRVWPWIVGGAILSATGVALGLGLGLGLQPDDTPQPADAIMRFR